MKKYFIREEDYNNSIGILTNNLHKDFILRQGIKWDEEFEEDDLIGQNPIITGVSYDSNCEKVSIYKIDEYSKFQHEIAEFNFNIANLQDEIAEFIQENYREITMSELDESIIKFKDYR